MGRPVIPEASVLGLRGCTRTCPPLRRSRRAARRRGLGPQRPRAQPRVPAGASRTRAGRHLPGRFAGHLLTVGEVSDLMERHGRAPRRARLRGSSLAVHLLGPPGGPPSSMDLVFERFLSRRAPTSRISRSTWQSARATKRLDRRDLPALRRPAGHPHEHAERLPLPRGRPRRRGSPSVSGPRTWTTWPASCGAFPARCARRSPAVPNRHPRGAAQGQPADGPARGPHRTPRPAAPPHLHAPCGVILPHHPAGPHPRAGQRIGLPMSQYDKHDMDPWGRQVYILGVRMQSTLAHAVAEITRLHSTNHPRTSTPRPGTTPTPSVSSAPPTPSGASRSISRASASSSAPWYPGVQRPRRGISLSGPGPTQVNMVRPYLNARHGLATATPPGPRGLPSPKPAAWPSTTRHHAHHGPHYRVRTRTGGRSAATAGSPRAPWKPAFRDGDALAATPRRWSTRRGRSSTPSAASGSARPQRGVAFGGPTQPAWLKTRHHPEAFMVVSGSTIRHVPGAAARGRPAAWGSPSSARTSTAAGVPPRGAGHPASRGRGLRDLDAEFPTPRTGVGIRTSLGAITGNQRR
ncbi:hypothetical protein QJS66_01950 [Kocuria rhizophila]|nr:hypothetical protein QJS66_01950 [Kocuria rhizophila]